jgi:hypothetical protein
MRIDCLVHIATPWKSLSFLADLCLMTSEMRGRSRCHGTSNAPARDWSAAMASNVVRGAMKEDSICKSFAA